MKILKSDLAWLALALLAITCPLPSVAQSFGGEIKSATSGLYVWVRGLGAALTVFGIVGAGIKIAVQHDREGMTKFIYVVVGGLIILLAPAFVNVLLQVAGNPSLNN
ncbi:MAG: hypothetical protein A2V88_09200 [Elusimicrobia bacterium RBG_16_66_12]|nr:MAG: hypothetical protein A2V88_09200 [Elusimicrobia bacterium RBG_16_66_12]